MNEWNQNKSKCLSVSCLSTERITISMTPTTIIVNHQLVKYNDTKFIVYTSMT